MRVLLEDYELANGEKATLLGGLPNNASFLWDAVEDVVDIFFEPRNKVYDRESFRIWFARIPEDAFVMIVNGEVGGCAYINAIKHGETACFHGYASPKYRTPKISQPVTAMALNYFREEHSLKQLEVVIKHSNRVAKRFSHMAGFLRSKNNFKKNKNESYYVAEKTSSI